MTTPDYSGLIAVAENAKREGYPIHVATRTTCAEHLEHGDDKADNFAFGQSSPRALTDAERYAAEAILDRHNADPDDDSAIVARAALRLALP